MDDLQLPVIMQCLAQLAPVQLLSGTWCKEEHLHLHHRLACHHL
jgi:hypothetical protein